MLKSHYKTESNSVEEKFCKPFGALKVRPMSKDETKIMLSAVIMDESDKNNFIDDEDKSLPDSLRIVRSSLKNRFTVTLTEPTQIMVATVCRSIGSIIMHLTYLQYRAKQMNKKELSVSDYADIFPNGVPTESELQKIWESQKIERGEDNILGSDNLLDYKLACKSIQFEDE